MIGRIRSKHIIMIKDDFEKVTFLEIRELFLLGKVELLSASNVEEEVDASIRAGNELWNKMTSINDIAPLLSSNHKSCQAWATHIIYEDGERGVPLLGLAVQLSSSPYSSVRNNICRCFYNYWDHKYLSALCDFISDENLSVKLNAFATIPKVTSRDFSYLCKNSALKDMATVSEYFRRFRSGDHSQLSELATSSNDKTLQEFHALKFL